MAANAFSPQPGRVSRQAPADETRVEYPARLLVHAVRDDIEPLGRLIAEAFHELPPDTWLVADAEERHMIMPRFFALWVAHALERGEVYTTVDKSAVAVWLTTHQPGDEVPEDYLERVYTIAGRSWWDRWRILETLMGRAAPDPPYEHLAFLAVHPDQQGFGIGTALLKAHHRGLAQRGGNLPVYLEATSLASRRFYLRHGYTDFASDPANFPDERDEHGAEGSGPGTGPGRGPTPATMPDGASAYPIVLPSGDLLYPMLRPAAAGTAT
jgi:GNAT superfamily N-acetyltransferase